MNIWSAFHSDTQSTNGNMNTETHISSLKHCGPFLCASFISTAGQRPWMLRTLGKCSFVQYQYQYVCISNVSVSIGYHHRFWPPPAADADLFWFCSLFRLCGWLCFLLRVFIWLVESPFVIAKSSSWLVRSSLHRTWHNRNCRLAAVIGLDYLHASETCWQLAQQRKIFEVISPNGLWYTYVFYISYTYINI